MTNVSILLSFIISISTFAECVHERSLRGYKILELEKHNQIFVESKNAKFKNSQDMTLVLSKVYKVHIADKNQFSLSKNNILNPHDEYNRTYLDYYTYSRIQKYLELNRQAIESAGLQINIIGKSLQGRNLYSIVPKNLISKKTILMFGRHHGDEGTANWIIEGFLSEYLSNKKFRDEYQLVLYPMINPDGAEAHSRYNSNGRDLNRSWHKSLSESYDEIKTIHTDLKKKMKIVQNDIFIALDMHGSFREDFIYRVKKNYVDRAFFNIQQNFIDELGIFDSWQNANDKKSNGDKRMARIVLIDHYKKNAMTHESIRNISKNNSDGRSLKTLKDQGVAIIKTIQNLY